MPTATKRTKKPTSSRVSVKTTTIGTEELLEMLGKSGIDLDALARFATKQLEVKVKYTGDSLFEMQETTYGG